MSIPPHFEVIAKISPFTGGEGDKPPSTAIYYPAARPRLIHAADMVKGPRPLISNSFFQMIFGGNGSIIIPALFFCTELRGF